MRNPTLAKPRVGLNYHRCSAACLSYERQVRALKDSGLLKYVFTVETAAWVVHRLRITEAEAAV